MSDINIDKLTKEKYIALAHIVAVPDGLDAPEQAEERFLHMLAGQSALISMVVNDMRFLIKSNLVPEDLGRVLVLQAQALAQDVEKAMAAAVIIRQETCDCPPCTEARKLRNVGKKSGDTPAALTVPNKKDMN